MVVSCAFGVSIFFVSSRATLSFFRYVTRESMPPLPQPQTLSRGSKLADAQEGAFADHAHFTTHTRGATAPVNTTRGDYRVTNPEIIGETRGRSLERGVSRELSNAMATRAACSAAARIFAPEDVPAGALAMYDSKERLVRPIACPPGYYHAYDGLRTKLEIEVIEQGLLRFYVPRDTPYMCPTAQTAFAVIVLMASKSVSSDQIYNFIGATLLVQNIMERQATVHAHFPAVSLHGGEGDAPPPPAPTSTNNASIERAPRPRPLLVFGEPAGVASVPPAKPPPAAPKKAPRPKKDSGKAPDKSIPRTLFPEDGDGPAKPAASTREAPDGHQEVVHEPRPGNPQSEASTSKRKNADVQHTSPKPHKIVRIPSPGELFEDNSPPPPPPPHAKQHGVPQVPVNNNNSKKEKANSSASTDTAPPPRKKRTISSATTEESASDFDDEGEETTAQGRIDKAAREEARKKRVAAALHNPMPTMDDESEEDGEIALTAEQMAEMDAALAFK